MIPKIIHLCWLSGDAFPKDIAVCLKSWKQHLSDYEIWLWGKMPKDCLGLNIVEKHFDLDSVVWCKQAFETKKYAFAADYIRLYALYNYGGIYMDSDVIVYKSFNDLLHLPYFIGEDYVHCFEPAIIGTEEGMTWLGKVLKRYDKRPFVKLDGELDMLALPSVFLEELDGRYRFKLLREPVAYSLEENVIQIFSKEYFNSRDYIKAIRTPKSYCAHNYMGSWLKAQGKFKTVLKKWVPSFIANFCYAMMFKTIYRNVASKRLNYE